MKRLALLAVSSGCIASGLRYSHPAYLVLETYSRAGLTDSELLLASLL
jgi:hypothetical protein